MPMPSSNSSLGSAAKSWPESVSGKPNSCRKSPIARLYWTGSGKWKSSACQDAALRTEDGRRIEVEAIANMYWEGEKRVAQFNIRDITERKLFDRQLQQTAKLESLGLLAGGVAHDFNNLLTGIMGNASLILDNCPASSPDREHLRGIVKATQGAADLTRQMLAYSGRGRFVVELIDFSELVREIRSLMRSSIPKTIDIELDLATDLAPVHADATQIRQLVMNLVINAAEAIGEGKPGWVRITSRQERFDEEFVRLNFPGGEIKPGTFVTLEVADSGAGMDEATKARIFDPFFTTKFTGRGLGALRCARHRERTPRGHPPPQRPWQGNHFQGVFPRAALRARPQTRRNRKHRICAGRASCCLWTTRIPYSIRPPPRCAATVMRL